MAYAVRNFKSGKALKDAVKNGERVEVYQPGPFGPAVADGETVIEGPHYPAAHTFYVRVQVEGGVIQKVLK